MTSSEVAELAAKLDTMLPSGSKVVVGAGDADPHVVLVSSAHGLIAIDVFNQPISAATPSWVETAGGSRVPNPLTAFAPKIESLRAFMQAFPSVPVHAFVVLTATGAAQLRGLIGGFPPRLVAASDDLEAALDDRRASVDARVLSVLIEHLAPASDLDARVPDVHDPARKHRHDLRGHLDREQAAIAAELSDGVTLVDGVAGSGKTLVLAARAQLLAREHPSWEIEVVCYNRVLVEHLVRMIGPHPSITVMTSHVWLNSRGIRQPSIRAEDFDDQLRVRLQAALSQGVGAQSVDAILVDEAQDLTADLLNLLHAAVRPGRGGMLVVRDLSQSLYQESGRVLGHADPERKVLRHNHRNTAQIGRFALGSVFGEVTSVEDGHDPRRPLRASYRTDGEKVQVVWAESWDGQAAFVAREARRLVDDGIVGWDDIGVLYTQYRAQTKRLIAALEAEGIPHTALTWEKESRRSFDLAAPGVKVLTVHSAKGLDFSVVFLFGVEALRVPERLVDADVRGANFTRVAYVGMTRAQDLLYLTYTRPNVIVRRCLELAQDAEFRRFPDDYVS